MITKFYIVQLLFHRINHNHPTTTQNKQLKIQTSDPVSKVLCTPENVLRDKIPIVITYTKKRITEKSTNLNLIVLSLVTF